MARIETKTLTAMVTLSAADGVVLDAVMQHGSCEPQAGGVVLVHGITADRDEYGMFVRLADRLCEAGHVVLRFSFRGHGASGGTGRGATIAGERLDLEAALAYMGREAPGPLTLVAASFGAVATCLALEQRSPAPARLVLWNPVLDLRRTFVEPELAWGVANFGPAQQERLASDGFLVVDGEFELGRVMFDEFSLYQPLPALLASRVPLLVVHGDRDTAVSYDIARAAVEARGNAELYTVAGSDHGFDSREREDEAIDATVRWLAAQQD